MRSVARGCTALLLALVGCGFAAKPSTVETTKIGSNGVTQKPIHDYTGWKTYDPKEGRFELKFPGDPVLRDNTKHTPITHDARIAREGADVAQYYSNWFLREEAFKSREAESTYLTGLQGGVVKGWGGKLLIEKSIEHEGFTGREFIIEDKDGIVRRYRAYVAGKRVILTGVAGKNQDVLATGDALKFLDSLTISQ